MTSRASRLGMYNVDPAVRFFATPPIDGCLCEEVIHPAAFTYHLPDSMSFGEGALLEPTAVGMWAATKARIKPGDVCVVTGSGTVGMHHCLCCARRWRFQGACFGCVFHQAGYYRPDSGRYPRGFDDGGLG